MEAAPVTAPNDTAPLRLRRRLAIPPTAASWAGMLVLWWAALRPSLLPRSAVTQGLVGGICAAVGFGLGGFVGRLVVGFAERRGRTVRWPNRSDAVRYGTIAVAALAVVVGSLRWLWWQQDQQVLVQVPQHSWTAIPVMWVTTVVVTALLVTIARLVRHAVAAFDRFVARHIRRHVRLVVVPAITLIVVACSILGLRAFANWADTNFGAFDQTTEDGVEPPTAPTVSGSPESLVEWDDLGLQGRSFVAGAPTTDELQQFAPGEEVVDPIRVYVGLQSADTVDERVELAIEELRRTGGFDREVLVVVTPTGTGWVNPDAARTLEYMHRGDTAIVSVQYSYLPSWIAFIVDTQSPRELGQALLAGIHEAWSELPANDRPLLLAYGESLGSMGAESYFAGDDVAASIEAITSTYEGALFVGPTRNNNVFGRMIDGRDDGSPTWRPVLADEPNTRVANKVAEVGADDATWLAPRVLWLHHPSDAIGTWKISNLWSPPGWADDPAPHDIPPAATWLPFVTFVQETFDLMNGFSATPGFGHDYRTDLVHGWAAIAPPEGWTEDDSAELRTFLGLDGGP